MIGENRVQETIHKLDNVILPKNIELHLIGHLQSNKINKAIKFFDVIQTVDSIKLANKINLTAQNHHKIQRVYIQVNIGNDASKHGFSISEVLDSAKVIHSLSNLTLEGIMMIPPFLPLDNTYRSLFKKTKQLQLDIYNNGIKTCTNISMGMSRDYNMAIEEGATHIRIGTALYGNRS
tara:strand:- start:911 stop:1444 length:534 start_codon:yes stop_codon:yes gene_type:complete